MSPHNQAACIGNDCDAVLSGEIITSAACWMSSLRYIVACVLLRIILTELDREIAGPGRRVVQRADDSPGNRPVSKAGGTVGDVDLELVAVIQAWAELPESVKAAIRALVLRSSASFAILLR